MTVDLLPLPLMWPCDEGVRGPVMGRRTFVCAAISLTVAAVAATTLPPGHGIAIVYPDVEEPYRSVFAKIIEGIDAQAQGHVHSFAVGPTPDTQEIVSEMRREDVRVVIALGRNGIKFTSVLERGIGVVAGGVLSIPEPQARNISVQSLAPDPALLFAHLRVFAPGIKRVFVVYDRDQNGWLIRLAKDAAGARGLELARFEAGDLKTALRFYQGILSTADPERDALWLPQDSTTVDDASVLPMVLEQTWARSLVFFSSSAAHVRRGALFSLYPDNIEIGRDLASTALEYLSASGASARGIRPLKSARLAVNSRTASHLGIALPPAQASDLVFPER